MKVCNDPQCTHTGAQHLDNFYNANWGDGKAAACKDCYKRRSKTWRDNNLERAKAKDREYKRKLRTPTIGVLLWNPPICKKE